MSQYRDLTGEINRIMDQKLNNSNANMKRIVNSSISSYISDDITVINFKQSGTTKMAIGFVKDITGTYDEPGIVFGAGDGNGNNRGFITKDTNSLNLFYVGNLALNEVAGLAIYKDKIETSVASITFNKDLVNEFVVDATNWNNKLYEADMKSLIENGSKNYAIPNENILDLNADKLNAGYITTQSWDGTGSDYQLLYRQYHQFKEGSSGLVKLAMGFVYDKDGSSTIPGIVLGSGAGNDTSVAKGYISKDANGLNLFYVSAANAAQGITIKSDGIYCTSELKLDTTLAQSYVTQSGWLSNLTQKLNSSGNFGVNQSGKRIELSNTMIGKNSSGQYMGLYIDPAYSDMYLYYNNSEVFKLYNGVDYVSMNAMNNNILNWYDNSDKLELKFNKLTLSNGTAGANQSPILLVQNNAPASYKYTMMEVRAPNNGSTVFGDEATITLKRIVNSAGDEQVFDWSLMDYNDAKGAYFVSHAYGSSAPLCDIIFQFKDGRSGFNVITALRLQNNGDALFYHDIYAVDDFGEGNIYADGKITAGSYISTADTYKCQGSTGVFSYKYEVRGIRDNSGTIEGRHWYVEYTGGILTYEEDNGWYQD